MKRFLPVLKLLVLVAVIAIICVSADVLAKGGRGSGCPREGIQCPMVWDPVFCTSTGLTYSNACVAFVACATGCTGGGGGA